MRRDSRLKGREGLFWQPFSKRNARRYLQAAERYDCAGRMVARRDRTGRQIGPLGPVALDVLRMLLRKVDWKTGQLDPALKTIAYETGHSVGGVVAALKRLATHGFTKWMRRYVPTGNEGRGPQVQQASNAYSLHLPEKAARLLPPDSPEPVDFEHARAAKAAAYRAMIDALPIGERAQADCDHPGLGAALDRWHVTVAARDAQDRLAEARQRMSQNVIQSRGENPAPVFI